MNRWNLPSALLLAALVVSTALAQDGSDVRHLTLTEAVHLAMSQNRALKIARLKVTEKEQRKAGERSAYFRRSPINRTPCTSRICRISPYLQARWGQQPGRSYRQSTSISRRDGTLCFPVAQCYPSP